MGENLLLHCPAQALATGSPWSLQSARKDGDVKVHSNICF